eukprot:TRINITY_DN2371_c0_g1_i3.p1 TRINITY_DN2371_c0_g1~~TRINITY_DN2371_c0_g1_i3.p1  ORF type:complete len:480 (+),score=109.25 TRINITY_DN2371_c0_g1_i3:68-1507(+)
MNSDALIRVVFLVCIICCVVQSRPIRNDLHLSHRNFTDWYSRVTKIDDAHLEAIEPMMRGFKSNRAMLAKDVPRELHITLGNEANSVVITWTTYKRGLKPIVYYGKIKNDLNKSTTGKSTSYTVEEMCGAESAFDGEIHSVRLENLEYDVIYYYKAGSDDSKVFSTERMFRSPPRPGGTQETRLVYLADMGITPNANRVAMSILDSEVKTGFAQAIIHGGDISYADGEEEIWADFMDMMEPITSRVPYFVAVGNHEYQVLSGGECGVPFLNRFPMPRNGITPANMNYWYSFNYGLVHVLVISTEHSFMFESDQYEFIREDLENVDRAVTPWVFVVGHQIMYSTNKREFAAGMRDQLEPLFYEYGVDLGLYGHSHIYERSCPVFQEKCLNETKAQNDYVDPGATIHLVVGTGGRGTDTFDIPFPPYSLVRKQVYGYSRIRATKTRLQFDMMDVNTNTAVDSFTITRTFNKPKRRPFPKRN